MMASTWESENSPPSRRHVTSCAHAHSYMSKIDLANAYRSVPMAPEWWPRHALQWEGQVYMDLRMPFGNSGAPAAFDRITQAIVRHMKASGYPAFVGYLDDFFLIAHRKKGDNPTIGE